MEIIAVGTVPIFDIDYGEHNIAEDGSKFIDNDIHIQTYKTDHSIFSVDTEIDLINAIEYARKIS